MAGTPLTVTTTTYIMIFCKHLQQHGGPHEFVIWESQNYAWLQRNMQICLSNLFVDIKNQMGAA
jgi:hypothetical protein